MSARQHYVIAQDAARSPREIGAKAAALSRFASLFPVPEFFVIAATAFTTEGIKPAARAQAAPALAELGAGPFAVRSSAREEDGAEHAHAGQYATELGVRSEDVFTAAERVWRSGFAESVVQYRSARGLSGAPHAPAVIVQRMIEPRAAGIAFSACPVSGDRGVAVISAVAGRADRLAAGDADGDTFNVSETGAVVMLSANAAPVLSESDCRAVAALVRACASASGAPQDIEWAFEDDKLYLLQTRPITTLGRAKTAIWDNSNIVESYPGVVAPLTYSFARHIYANVYRAFASLMGVSAARIAANAEVFDEMLGRIDGRVYYNLLNWYRALALFPGFKANRAFMEQMMGVAEALPPDLAARLAPPANSFWAKALDCAGLARVAAGLVFHALTLQRTSARFRARLDAGLRTPDAAIDAASAQELAREYRRLERLLLARWDAPLINDFLCMIAFGASRRALEAWAGADGLALHGDVMIGQGDIISAEPARRIRAMGALARRSPAVIDQLAAGDARALADIPELADAFGAYIARFGDRCVQELKLESPSLHQDATPLLLAIAAAARATTHARRAESADASTQLRRLFKAKPLKRAIAAWLLTWARARVRDRENLRFERTRLFGRVRRLFRALGARLTEAGALAEPSDIFYLTVDEALAAAEGSAASELQRIAAVRRAEDAASAARPNPPERIDSSRTKAAPAENNEGELRKGLGCCTGIVTGRVRVIADPRQEALAAGEILVACSTDPGWIAAFANAAGIIAERGSLLSHSAIVSREMGVPCVVGLKHATKWLKTGDIVRLDGGTGEVERIAHDQH